MKRKGREGKRKRGYLRAMGRRESKKMEGHTMSNHHEEGDRDGYAYLSLARNEKFGNFEIRV